MTHQNIINRIELMKNVNKSLNFNLFISEINNFLLFVLLFAIRVSLANIATAIIIDITIIIISIVSR